MRKKIFHDPRSWQLIANTCLQCIDSLSTEIHTYLQQYGHPTPLIPKTNPQFNTRFRYYSHLVIMAISEKLNLFWLTNALAKRKARNGLFLDLYPQLCSIRAMSRLISQSRYEDEQGVIELYDEVPRVLHTLLRCLSLTRDFVLCIAQSYARIRARGNLVSSQIPDTIITC